MSPADGPGEPHDDEFDARSSDSSGHPGRSRDDDAQTAGTDGNHPPSSPDRSRSSPDRPRSTRDPTHSTLDRSRSTLDRLPFADDRVLQALLLIVLVGLAMRLVLLGDRVAHFDEGRVAYWVVHSMDSGSFAYRRIIHGPLIQHVDRWVFTLLGANDFTMRLPVAILGALLPLSALLFRAHLRRIEVVLVGAILAFNPILLYYSRFMRSDLLVATFMFVALGLVVRYYDTRKTRYLYLASASTALGFGSKENAVVYVLVWVGAAALLADQALYRPRRHQSGASLLAVKGRALRSRLFGPDRRWRGAALVAFGHAFWIAVVFVAISVVIYAPRGAGMDGLFHPPVPPSEGSVGLWQAVGNPLLVPDLVTSTANHAVFEFGEWFGSASDPGCNKDNVIDGWLCYFGRFLEVMATKAAPLSLFAVGGFLYERYGRATSRNLVMFMTYAGVVSVIGYPLGTDVWGAWLAVHAVVPLSIPAAVGLAVVVRWGYEAFADDDQVGVAIAAVILLLLAGVTGAVVVQSVYLNDQSEDNALVQFAQPGGDAQPALTAMATISEEAEEPHVLIYHGETGAGYDSNRAWVQEHEGDFDRSGMAFYPMCTMFHNTLPLPWYLAKDDVDVTCERDQRDLRVQLREDPPPIVVTQGYDSTVPRTVLGDQYVERTYEWRTYTRDTSFWFHEDYADALPDR